jgi:hypothetical protein
MVIYKLLQLSFSYSLFKPNCGDFYNMIKSRYIVLVSLSYNFLRRHYCFNLSAMIVAYFCISIIGFVYEGNVIFWQ